MESRTSGVPAPALHELRRERLLESLHKHRARPLILLVAAAGFGKSTLAATYARDSGGAVAWLTLRPAERDTRRLFERLADALDAGFGEPGSVPELRRGLQDGAEGVGLARLLLDDLAQAPSGFIIVLDDFHLVGESEDVVNSIDTLIRDLPEAGQIVITARDAPALSMTRLVVEDAVFPLGAEDLRFSPEEAKALRKKIRESASEEPADPRVEADEDIRDEQAEGWVAGILLGGAPRTLNIGGGSLLGTYVEREVLSRLSPTQRGWLEMLSVFDIITPQAAERALGPANWPARLLALTERCPFLVGDHDGSYRLHGLVRETVLNHLRRSQDDRAKRAWTVARDLAEEAADPVGVVRACQELGQIDGAVRLVQRTASEAAQAGRWAAVLVTLELLPAVLRRANPDLSLIEAHALILTGHPEPAREAAEAVLHHGGRSGDVFLQISAIIELAMIGVSTDISTTDDWLNAADHLLRTGDLTVEQRRLLEGRALGWRAISYAIRGEPDHAREAFERSARLLSLLGPSRDLAVVQQNFGSFCNRIGDYAGAQTALAAAASHWRLMGDRYGLSTAQAVLGDLHLRAGNLDAAGAELMDALSAARAVGALRTEAWAMVDIGEWHRANGRLAQALDAYELGAHLAEAIVERELLAQVLACRAEVALLQDDLNSARAFLSRAQAEAQVAGSARILGIVDRAVGRLHLVDGAAARAASYLEEALDRGGGSWGPDDRAQTLYWLGTAYLSLHRGTQAVDYLEQAVNTVQQANIPAALARPVAEDPRLLQEGRKVGINPVVLGEIERLAQRRATWTENTRTAEPLLVAVKNDLPRVEVRLFGSFVLYRNGELVQQPSRKVDRVREFASLLILNPKGISDDDIAETMFPEMPRETALHNVQMAAYKLRKELDSKVAVQYSKKTYQLNPRLELIADVHSFDEALARARGATGDTRIQALSRAIDLYRGPLLPDAAWPWLESVRLDYRTRFVSAALLLADLLAVVDLEQSDKLAEDVLAEAPDSDVAYERLLQNAQRRHDENAVRRIMKRYEHAAAQFGFTRQTQARARG